MKKLYRTYIKPLKDGSPLVMTQFLVLAAFLILEILLPSLFLLLILLVLFILFLLFINFFRNPERRTEYDPRGLYAPADGVVTSIEKVREKEYLKSVCHRVKIFMNIFNVHRNRVPLQGIVEMVKYKKGKMQAAFREVEQSNEQFIILLRTRYGRVLFKQIAGLVARRIVCHLKKGDKVRTGELFGMIRLGSAVIVYIPLKFKITIKKADNVKAGLSQLASTGK